MAVSARHGQNGRSQGQASGLSPLSEPPSCRARSPCTIHPSLTQRASQTRVQALSNGSGPKAVAGMSRAVVKRQRWP
jgi:hypothetical protein